MDTSNCLIGVLTRVATGVGLLSAAGFAKRSERRAAATRLINLQAQLQKAKLLIVDELDYVPHCQVGAELPFEVCSQRYERGSTLSWLVPDAAIYDRSS